jgi:diaminopimelate dehydrogenase
MINLGFYIYSHHKTKYSYMRKIRAAIVGYGNIGKYTLQALNAAPDFEVAGIVRRSGAENLPQELEGYNVVKDIRELGDVDVAILSTPTRSVEKYAKDILALGINTVDSFDIHSKILDLRRSLGESAEAGNAVAIISAGWDPGSDSVVRTLLEAIAPKGITYTNFGPGMSMGHTVAVKAVEGVKAALSMTIPVGTGIHRRMVYIELEEGYDFNQVAATIKSDPYFVNDETHVINVPCVDDLLDMGHGVNLTRKGVSGTTQNQLFEFNMRINNPALTAQVLVCCARATMRQQPGCYTMVEIPVIDLLHGDREQHIAHLV